MLHELGHGFGFGGFVGGGPISDVFDATTLGVFDTFFEEVEGGFVFNGENVVRVAGRPLELNEELSRGFLSHFGNLPATFQGFSAYPGFGDDLGAMVMAGFFFLRDVRYYITAADIAVLEDVGVPIRRPSESDDLLYGYEVPDPGIEANYGVPNASFLSGNDSIDALDGDDTIYGFSGADTLKGGSGADLLEGARVQIFWTGAPAWTSQVMPTPPRRSRLTLRLEVSLAVMQPGTNMFQLRVCKGPRSQMR